MQIHVSTSTGTGPTTLSAFDSALHNAGIANYNLLVLSSVIPPESRLTVHQTSIPSGVISGEWGDRLYLVMAESRTDIVGMEVWAGIGWVQDKASGKGLFVEHEGGTETKVRADIEASLRALMKTRGIDFGEVHMVVSGATCTGEPVCAMAVAVYQTSGWQNKATLLGA